MNCFDQFHDACGVGVLAHLRGKSSHLLREAAIQDQPARCAVPRFFVPNNKDQP